MTDLLRPIKDQIHGLWARVDRMPTVTWGTVATVSPLTVFLDGDLDTDLDPVTAPARSAVNGLTAGDRVLCVDQHRRVIVVSRAGTYTRVPDTGWVDLSPYLLSGFTSFAFQARRIGNIVTIRSSGINGTWSTSANVTDFASGIPAQFHPHGNMFGAAYQAGTSLSSLARNNGTMAISRPAASSASIQFTITYLVEEP